MWYTDNCAGKTLIHPKFSEGKKKEEKRRKRKKGGGLKSHRPRFESCFFLFCVTVPK